MMQTRFRIKIVGLMLYIFKSGMNPGMDSAYTEQKTIFVGDIVSIDRTKNHFQELKSSCITINMSGGEAYIIESYYRGEELLMNVEAGELIQMVNIAKYELWKQLRL